MSQEVGLDQQQLVPLGLGNFAPTLTVCIISMTNMRWKCAVKSMSTLRTRAIVSNRMRCNIIIMAIIEISKGLFHACTSICKLLC